MATVNSMSSDNVVLDPFYFQETVLVNFLRSQGLLPGQCIRHFPHKVSTSPCSWADIIEDDPCCNVPEPVVYVRHCSKEFSLIISKTLMLLFPKAVNFHQLQNLNYQYKISNTTRETRRLARSQSDECIKAYP